MILFGLEVVVWRRGLLMKERSSQTIKPRPSVMIEGTGVPLEPIV